MSNQEIIPGVEPLPCKVTTFREAITLVGIEGRNDSYEAFVPPDWCTTHMKLVHGGFLTSLIQAATRQYFRLQHPSLAQPDVLGVHVQYQEPVPGGVVFLKVKELKIGRKVSMVQVEVLTKGKDGEPFVCITALVNQGNLATEQGPSGPMTSTLKDRMPRREECVRFGDAWWMNLIPITRKLRQFVPIGGPDLRWKSRFGGGVREVWVKMDDCTGFETLYLGKLCDAFLTVPTSFPLGKNEAVQELLKYIYPTVSMTMNIRKDPKGSEWLFLRIESRGVWNGRSNAEVTVLDELGEVVAVCQLVVLVIEIPPGLNVIGNTLKL